MVHPTYTQGSISTMVHPTYTQGGIYTTLRYIGRHTHHPEVYPDVHLSHTLGIPGCTPLTHPGYTRMYTPVTHPGYTSMYTTVPHPEVYRHIHHCSTP